ncbi:MAG: hypothetical protein JOZ94_08390 [Xanthobacteraceae bacterium]|nr:hypothetical protein [Xanthobacteraceae bacterium]MBV9630949.1 hypothetical protein [Xanthobacteraceae bacterium]
MAEQIEANFDPDTLALLKRVLVEAEQSIPVEARTSALKVQIAFRILKAARAGERNPIRLRSAGLCGIDPRIIRSPLEIAPTPTRNI